MKMEIKEYIGEKECDNVMIHIDDRKYCVECVPRHIAALLAAAPDLLEALKAITAAYSDLLQATNATIHIDLVKKANTAVDKAESR